METKLEEAAEEYWAKQPYNEDAFIEGAKSNAARDYWFEIFKTEENSAKWQQEHHGLMEIELNHTKTLLESCEKSLEDRDKKIIQ